MASRSVLALAVAVGCSGGSGGGSAPGGTGGNGKGGTGGASGNVALADFGRAFEAAYCAPLVACGVYPDLTNCEAATLFAESNFVLTAVGAVGRGTSRYDAAAAAACIAALPSTCIVTQDSLQPTLLIDAPLDLLRITTACANVFTGTLGQGATCQSSLECGATAPGCSPIDQTSCSLTTCCPGTCQPLDFDPAFLMPHPLGEDCTNNNLCQLPAVCTGTCTMPPADGEGCNPSAVFPCQRLDEFCDVPTSPPGATGTCTARLAVGADCGSTEYVLARGCPLDGRCDANGTGSSTCSVWQTLGGSCRSASDCLAGLTCSAAGACAPVPTGMDCGAP